MKNRQQEWSRRNFIVKLTGAGAVLLLNPLMSWTTNEEDRVAKLVAKTIGIDTHNHIDVPLNTAELIILIFFR